MPVAESQALVVGTWTQSYESSVTGTMDRINYKPKLDMHPSQVCSAIDMILDASDRFPEALQSKPAIYTIAMICWHAVDDSVNYIVL